MPKVVISEFMDPAAIAADLSGFDTLYDPGLVDRPEALAAAVAEFDPDYDEDVGLAWRLVLSPGITYMRYCYDR